MTPNELHVSDAPREFAEAANAGYQALHHATQARLQSAPQSSPAMLPGSQDVVKASKAFAGVVNNHSKVALPTQVPEKTKDALSPAREQTPAAAMSQTPLLQLPIQPDPSAQSSQASGPSSSHLTVPAHAHISQCLKRKASDRPLNPHQAAKRAKQTQQSLAEMIAREKRASTIPEFAWNAAQISMSRNPTPSPKPAFAKPAGAEVMIPDQGSLPASNAFDSAMDPANDLGFPPEPQATRFDGAHGIAHDKVGARMGEPYFGEEHNYGKVMEHKKMDEMRDIEKRAFNSRTYDWLQQEQQRRKSSTLGYGYAFVGSQDSPGEVLVRVPRMPTVGAQESGSNMMEID